MLVVWRRSSFGTGTEKGVMMARGSMRVAAAHAAARAAPANMSM